MKKLKELFEEHKSIPYPSFPMDDKLYELITKLIELDGYYAGIIASNMDAATNKRETIDLSHLNKAKEQFIKYKELEQDKSIYWAWKKYIDSWEKLLSCYFAGNHEVRD